MKYGDGTEVVLSEIHYSTRRITNIYNGEGFWDCAGSPSKSITVVKQLSPSAAVPIRVGVCASVVFLIHK